MNYRIEFVTQDRDAGTVVTALDDVRFPIFLHAVAAARSRVMQWGRQSSAQVVVNIFDCRDRLTSSLQLSVPASEFAAR